MRAVAAQPPFSLLPPLPPPDFDFASAAPTPLTPSAAAFICRHDALLMAHALQPSPSFHYAADERLRFASRVSCLFIFAIFSFSSAAEHAAAVTPRCRAEARALCAPRELRMFQRSERDRRERCRMPVAAGGTACPPRWPPPAATLCESWFCADRLISPPAYCLRCHFDIACR